VVLYRDYGLDRKECPGISVDDNSNESGWPVIL